MSPAPLEIDTVSVAARARALPWLDRVREAAGEVPAFLVGGAVRDLLLGRDRADVDVVVEGDAMAVARALGGELIVHERFGTATVRDGDATLDLASARSESYASPGALPTVRAGTLADDLARRDFTINAIALPLRGEGLVDPHGGAADLEARVLRVLHARSFADDPTRALRAARYAARLGLELEEDTAGLLPAADLQTVSAERVEAEVRKLAAEPQAPRAFRLAASWGLIGLSEEELELIDQLARMLWAEPWRALASPAEAITHVALDSTERARALAAAPAPGTPSEGVAAAHGHSGPELAVARVMGAEWLDGYAAGWREVRLEIGGADLLAAGVPEGPAVGAGLEAALRAKLDGVVAGREEELRVALEEARG